MSTPTVLATIPGASENERLLVVLSIGGTSRVSLVQQSWTPGVGWYNQTSLRLTPTQLRQLRAALGSSQNRAAAAPIAAAPVEPSPSIIRFPGETTRAESA